MGEWQGKGGKEGERGTEWMERVDEEWGGVGRGGGDEEENGMAGEAKGEGREGRGVEGGTRRLRGNNLTTHTVQFQKLFPFEKISKKYFHFVISHIFF